MRTNKITSNNAYPHIDGKCLLDVSVSAIKNAISGKSSFISGQDMSNEIRVFRVPLIAVNFETTIDFTV
jgi:hypothetical protein